MKKVWVLAVAGVGAGLLLFAGSCAPAQAPAPPAPQAQPAQQQPAAKPAEQKPAAQQPAAPQPAAQQPGKPTKSVSGVPLDPDAKYGGVMIAAEGATPSPLVTWEESVGPATTISHMVTNLLVRFQTWGTLEDFKAQAWTKLHPDLATSWEQSPDGLRWTFKLRDGVLWSDGRPFTCEDAKWSLDTIRTGTGLRRSPSATLFLGVDRIECADALTMVIRMARPKPSLLDVAIRNGRNVIYPKHYYENSINMDEMRDKGPRVGSGPFTLKEFVPGEKFVLVRRKDYWDQPLPYLDGVELRFIGTAAIPIGIRAGRIDQSSHGATASGAAHETLVKECKGCQFWPRLISNNISTLIPNHNRPPWNVPEIKDALSLAVDRKQFIQIAAAGWGVPAVGGGFYPGTYWAMPLQRVNQIPGYDFDKGEENKARARELLAKAGYKPGELRLNLATNTPANIPPLLEELQAGGFSVTGKVLATPLFYDLLSSGEFELAHITTAITGGYDPDAITYEHFYTGSDRNYGRWANVTFERLVDQMSATLDPEERRRLAWDAMEIGLREHGKIILYHGEAASVFGPRVRGQMPPEFLGYGFFGVNQRYDHTWLVQ